MPSNVVSLRHRLPRTAAQADKLARLSRRERLIEVTIVLAHDPDWLRQQRAWRTLFGLYQDCASVRRSKGFKKTPGIPFIGKMRPSRLPLFLREGMQFVGEGRVEIHVNGERLRRRLLEVMVA